jgi:hypothetical protein
LQQDGIIEDAKNASPIGTPSVSAIRNAVSSEGEHLFCSMALMVWRATPTIRRQLGSGHLAVIETTRCALTWSRSASTLRLLPQVVSHDEHRNADRELLRDV